MTNVPKIFHQIWFGWDLPNPPPAAEKCRLTWEEHHPDWEFRLWSADDCRNLIEEHYSWFLETYDSYMRQIQRADAARIIILHHVGGVYLDHDYVCVKNIEPLLQDAEVYLPVEPLENCFSMRDRFPDKHLPHICSNAWMASIAGAAFWTHVQQSLAQARSSTDSVETLSLTGPVFLTEAWNAYQQKESVKILPATSLLPVSAREANREPEKYSDIDGWLSECRARDSYGAHMWSEASSHADTSRQNPLGGTSSWSEQIQIPRLFHMVWFNFKDPSVAQYPSKKAAECQRTWFRKHPNWELKLWNDSSARTFIAEHYPWFLKTYDAYPLPIHRADAVRYFILHHFGGVYIDFDFECVRNIEDIFESTKSFYAGNEPLSNHGHESSSPTSLFINNGWMASTPKSAFLKHVTAQLMPTFHSISKSEARQNVLGMAGPSFLTQSYLSFPHKEEVEIMHSSVLFPISYNDARTGLYKEKEDRLHKARSLDSYAIHLWDASWH